MIRCVSRTLVVRVWTTAALLLLLSLMHGVSAAEPPPKVNETTTWNETTRTAELQISWDDLNHYEVLQLIQHNNTDINPKQSKEERIKERQAISRTEIRKAYFKAAKLHHPDKVGEQRQQRQRQQADNTNTTPLSFAELNARMAKITGAYEVLSDEAKRNIYDQYLVHFEANEERKERYANEISKPCKWDDDCSDITADHCCIKYHFKFCGVRKDYPAQGLTCAGLSPRMKRAM